MLIRKLAIAGIAMGTGATAFAQDYFDFGQIPGLPAQPAVQIEVNPMILGFLTETARATDPAAAELLENLEGVRVRVYKTIEDIADVTDYIDDASEQLERANWQQVVTVDEGGHVRVYMQATSEAITGVTAMIVSDTEAVFVNIAGSITPQQLAMVANQLGAGEFLGALGPMGAVPSLN